MSEPSFQDVPKPPLTNGLLINDPYFPFQTVLESKREAMTRLLVQLVGEQQKREDELMKRLVSNNIAP